MAHRITLLPSGKVIPCPDGHTVLQAARATGETLPWGCGVGACRTCAARVHAGRISMPPGTALTDDHLRAHIVLPCVAVPRSDVTLEVGGRVGLLTPLPWTD